MKTKPRLFKLQGIWYCMNLQEVFKNYGMGYTASDAYIDWYVRRGKA